MNGSGTRPPADVERAIVTEYERQLAVHGDRARALQDTAIALGLSLRDCAVVLGLGDLLDELGDTWRIEFPADGPAVLRRP